MNHSAFIVRVQSIDVSEQEDYSCYILCYLIRVEKCQGNNPIEKHKPTIRLKVHSFTKY